MRPGPCITCLLGLTLLSAAAEASSRRVALVVGNNVADSSRARLRFAEADAVQMRSVFEGLGGVTRTVSLLGASAEALEDALGGLEAELAALGGDATLFFFYSGHADATALLMKDSRYEFDRLRARLGRVPARLVVAMVDACYAGEMTRSKGGVPVPITDVDLRDIEGQLRGHVFISSTAPGEAAQESDELGASFFTHYLVSALRGAADDSGDGKVSLEEAYRFVYRHTLDRTKSTLLGPQHPSYRFDVEGQGDLVLSWLEEGRSYLVLPESASGLYFFRPARGGVVTAEVKKESAGRLRIAVAPGAYRVSRVQDEYEYVQDLGVESGEEHVVDERMMVRRRLARGVARGPGEAGRLRLGASYELGSGYLEEAGLRSAGVIRLGVELGSLELGGLAYLGAGRYRRGDDLEVDLFELGGGVFAVGRWWFSDDVALGVGPEVRVLYVAQRAKRGGDRRLVEAPVMPVLLRGRLEVRLDDGWSVYLGGLGGLIVLEGAAGATVSGLASLEMGGSWSW